MFQKEEMTILSEFVHHYQNAVSLSRLGKSLYKIKSYSSPISLWYN
jgi:hypothetical protein